MGCEPGFAVVIFHLDDNDLPTALRYQPEYWAKWRKIESGDKESNLDNPSTAARLRASYENGTGFPHRQGRREEKQKRGQVG
jgi:hypothetical protein